MSDTVRHTIYLRIARWIYHHLRSPWGQRMIALLYVGGVAGLVFSSGTHWLLRAICIGLLSLWALIVLWLALL